MSNFEQIQKNNKEFEEKLNGLNDKQIKLLLEILF